MNAQNTVHSGRDILDDMLREYEEQEREINAMIATLPDIATAIQLAGEHGRTAIVHRSTRNAGKWQVSFFDQHGAIGDAERNTRSDALMTAIREYSYRDIVECV
jgi:hypothetical protein